MSGCIAALKALTEQLLGHHVILDRREASIAPIAVQEAAIRGVVLRVAKGPNETRLALGPAARMQSASSPCIPGCRVKVVLRFSPHDNRPPSFSLVHF